MLLLNTSLEEKLKKTIKGEVARVGGTVNQLLDYSDVSVHDFNVLDGGYGDVSKVQSISDISTAFHTLKRQVWQEVRHRYLGDRVPLDRKTIILDTLEAHTHPEFKHRYQACISSNVLEHSYNPIVHLLNFYFLTKKRGWQYHALPHYKFTFDVFRKPTPLSHMIKDFEKMTGPNDTTHTKDYVYSAVTMHGYKREYHQQYPVTYPFIHFHVFDEKNVKALFEFVFTDVTVDIIRTPEFSDILVHARNTLNPMFVSKYRGLIDTYSKEFLK